MATQPLPLLLFVTISSRLASSAATNAHYLEAACSVTQHRALCMHSLASFSHSAAWKQKNPCWWARAAVTVTLAEAKHVRHYLAKMKHGGRMRGGRAAALADCIECFGDAEEEFHSSLRELRRLEKRTFEYQMSNVETWLSAALTNQDTCLDGFGAYKGKETGKVKAKVLNATYFTSNALALVNNLASSGGFS